MREPQLRLLLRGSDGTGRRERRNRKMEEEVQQSWQRQKEEQNSLEE